ncbi:MAG: guanylate kinase [Alphaproteobacteria bacterium]|nr:guanylate kinase [Alphaproteobacteria bacterium]TAD91977.1 MAG: guanylate kinase [Alphaproteobacteria bacterium]
MTTPPPIRRRGLMLVLSSPSGAGKTTLSRLLLEEERGRLEMSVSVTTRPRRPSEVDGRDYHFIDLPRFEHMVQRGELLEWAEVFNNRYGTPRDAVESALSAGRDVLFDIDWQGTQQIARAARRDLVSVFILPPSYEELRRRLTTRAQDSADVIAGRMAKAADEMSHYDEYDYIVVNEDVQESLAQVHAILKAERQKRERLVTIADFVSALRG